MNKPSTAMASNNPLDRQVGGTHYKQGGPQHVEFCQMNRIPWAESCALKYVLRHRRKNGKEDIDKAIHYIEFAMALDYGRRADVPQDMNPSKFVISIEDFLKDKPLTKDERKVCELVLTHQKGGGDERKLMDAVKLLKHMLKNDYQVDVEGLELL